MFLCQSDLLLRISASTGCIIRMSPIENVEMLLVS